MKGIDIDSTNKYNKQNLINILFNKSNENEIKLLDSLNLLNNESYVLSKFYEIKTFKKKYYLSFFQNTEFSIQDVYFLIIKSKTDEQFYFIDECLSYDLYRFGDYNNDGNLEYAEIDSNNDVLLFFSLENGIKIENKSMRLKLKRIKKKNINENLYVIKCPQLRKE